jgi:hypothetical protein
VGQHARLINGRLLLAGRRPWHEWPAADLLDICDALREDEQRFLISLKAKISLPELPDVDTERIAIRTPAGLGFVDVTVPQLVDDGAWGLEDDSWQPPEGAEHGG